MTCKFRHVGFADAAFAVEDFGRRAFAAETLLDCFCPSIVRMAIGIILPHGNH
jgi:hypothetical protein